MQDSYDTCRLRIEFDNNDGGIPWTYALALNGRTIRELYVNELRYLPADLVKTCIDKLKQENNDLHRKYKAVVHENTQLNNQLDAVRRRAAMEVEE